MKDYASMSDFEIKCEVLAVFNPCIKHMCLSADNSCFYDCGQTGDGWYQIDIPDYCNNPSDAWPVILQSKISIFALDGDDWGARGYNCIIRSINPNPLRAAMELFLKMKESEK